MQAVLIARGDGYKGCTAFDGFVPVASPLPGYNHAERETRVFGEVEGKQCSGCDYSSHVLALAVDEIGSRYKGTRQLYILVQHGAGREVWRVPSFYDGGAFEAALVALPERLQYATLYTLYNMAAEARRQGGSECATKYATAFVEKRLKVKRRNGRKTVEIIPPVPAAAVKDSADAV